MLLTKVLLILLRMRGLVLVFDYTCVLMLYAMDLSFYGVLLGEEAVCALSAALQLSSAASMLTAIGFSGNRLGDAACSAPLRALLQHARRLQVLDLSSNEMSGAGCTALANGLGAHFTGVTGTKVKAKSDAGGGGSEMPLASHPRPTRKRKAW